MGIETTICPLAEQDAIYAVSAARWVQATHPGISVGLSSSSATVSGSCPSDEMARIWQTGLLNERLVETAALARRSVLESLVK